MWSSFKRFISTRNMLPKCMHLLCIIALLVSPSTRGNVCKSTNYYCSGNFNMDSLCQSNRKNLPNRWKGQLAAYRLTLWTQHYFASSCPPPPNPGVTACPELKLQLWAVSYIHKPSRVSGAWSRRLPQRNDKRFFFGCRGTPAAHKHSFVSPPLDSISSYLPSSEQVYSKGRCYLRRKRRRKTKTNVYETKFYPIILICTLYGHFTVVSCKVNVQFRQLNDKITAQQVNTSFRLQTFFNRKLK